ncbi:MAG: hypothetical protein ACRCSB_04435 [Bacteroidales bacterium]
MYMTIPYTKVKIMPAVIAGILAGSLFHLVQNVYYLPSSDDFKV